MTVLPNLCRPGYRLGLAYAGSNREDVLSLLLPVMGDSKSSMEVRKPLFFFFKLILDIKVFVTCTCVFPLDDNTPALSGKVLLGCHCFCCRWSHWHLCSISQYLIECPLSTGGWCDSAGVWNDCRGFLQW